MASIYRRANGVYYVKLRRADRWVYRSLRTRSRRQAEAELRSLIELERATRHAAAPTSGLTVAQLEILYLDWAAHYLRPKTIELHQSAFRQFRTLCPVARIDRITPSHIDQVRSARLAQGASHRTVNILFACLRASVAAAAAQGWYHGRNPFAGLRPLPERHHLPRFLSDAERDALLEAAQRHSPDAHLYFALGLLAGLRKSEIIEARWSWFDFPRNIITVRQSATYTTKSGRDRALPLFPTLRAILEQYGPGQPAAHLVRPAKRPGRHPYRFEARKLFRAVAQAAGLTGISPHDLRHHFGAACASRGISLYKLQRWLGHASPRTTQIYAHLRPDTDEPDPFT